MEVAGSFNKVGGWGGECDEQQPGCGRQRKLFLAELPHAAFHPSTGITAAVKLFWAGSQPLLFLLATDCAVVLQARPLQRAVAAAS